MNAEDFRVKRDYMAQRGWPERSLDAAFRADPTKPAMQALQAWKADEKNVVVLSGPVGVGKTIAVARWCLEKPTRIAFSRATTFAASSRYDQEARARYYGSAGLCLDDLGTEYADTQESFLVDLDELVDTYYADARPLLITTNLKSAEFQARYGARVWDRLHDCAAWIAVKGESLRRATP